METLHKINFLSSLFHICTSTKNLFYLISEQERVNQERGYQLLSLSLSFHVITFSVSSWLLKRGNINKNKYDRRPWSFTFLKTPVLSFCASSDDWSSFWRVANLRWASASFSIRNKTALSDQDKKTRKSSHWLLNFY